MLLLKGPKRHYRFIQKADWRFVFILRFAQPQHSNGAFLLASPWFRLFPSSLRCLWPCWVWLPSSLHSPHLLQAAVAVLSLSQKKAVAPPAKHPLAQSTPSSHTASNSTGQKRLRTSQAQSSTATSPSSPLPPPTGSLSPRSPQPPPTHTSSPTAISSTAHLSRTPSPLSHQPPTRQRNDLSNKKGATYYHDLDGH